MKIERSKNAARNVAFAVILKIYNMLAPFAVRTVLIYCLGVQYLGLNSLFSSILSVLGLAELGVGSAMVFSMYKPIAEDDHATLCALMRLYKIYYRVIGIVILVLGLACLPFIPKFINGDVPPDMNIYVLYLMNLGVTVLTYWLFAYKNCLFTAYQRNDILTKINLVILTFKYGGQIATLVVMKNYYAYLVVAFAAGILNNIVVALFTDKYYPHLKAGGKLPKEMISSINKRVRDLFIIKIGGVIIESSDTIVISSFLSLSILGIYQNYTYVVAAIYGFVYIFFTSAMAGIGNSFVTESEEKNLMDLRKFTFIIAWISIFCICCFGSVLQPFIELWVGEENMLGYAIVIILCIYTYEKNINTLLNTYKDAAGIWHKDRFRPFITAVVNLTLNLLMVKKWGIYGVLASTVVSDIIVGIPWLFYNLFTTVFHSGLKKYIKQNILYILLATALTAMCVFICYQITFNSLILTIALRLAVCGIFPNVIMLALFRKTQEFKGLVAMADSLTKGKIKFLKKLS